MRSKADIDLSPDHAVIGRSYSNGPALGSPNFTLVLAANGLLHIPATSSGAVPRRATHGNYTL
jgi:hypothetical protein